MSFTLTAYDEAGAYLAHGFTEPYLTIEAALEAGDELHHLTGAEVVATDSTGTVVGVWG